MIVQEPKQYDPGTAGFAIVAGHVAGDANHINVINLATGVSQVANTPISSGAYANRPSAATNYSVTAASDTSFYIDAQQEQFTYNLTKISIANFSTTSNFSGAAARDYATLAPSAPGRFVVVGGYSYYASSPTTTSWLINTNTDSVSNSSATIDGETGWPASNSSPQMVSLMGGSQSGSVMLTSSRNYYASTDSVTANGSLYTPNNRQCQATFSTGVGPNGSFGYIIGGHTSNLSGTSLNRSRVIQATGTLDVLANATGISAFASGFSASNNILGVMSPNGGNSINLYSYSSGVFTASSSTLIGNRWSSLGSYSSISPIYSYYKFSLGTDGTLSNESGRIINTGGGTYGGYTASVNASEISPATQVRTAVSNLTGFIQAGEFSGTTNTYLTGGGNGSNFTPVNTTAKYNYATSNQSVISATLGTALAASSTATSSTEAFLLHGTTNITTAVNAINYKQKFSLITEQFQTSATVVGSTAAVKMAKLQDYDKAFFLSGINSSSAFLSYVEGWSHSTDIIYVVANMTDNIGAGSPAVASPTTGYIRYNSTHAKVRSTPFTQTTMSSVIQASDQYASGSGQAIGYSIGGNVSSAATTTVNQIYFTTDTAQAGTALSNATIYATGFSTVTPHLRFRSASVSEPSESGVTITSNGVTTDNSSGTAVKVHELFKHSTQTITPINSVVNSAGFDGSGIGSGSRYVSIQGFDTAGSTTSNQVSRSFTTLSVYQASSFISRYDVGTYSNGSFGLFIGGSGSSSATQMYMFSSDSLLSAPGSLNTYISQTYAAGNDSKVHKTGGLHNTETTIGEVLSLPTMGWISTASLNLPSARRGYGAQAGFGSLTRSHQVGGASNSSTLVSSSTVAPFATDTTATGPTILGGVLGGHSSTSDRTAANLFGGTATISGTASSSILRHNFSRETTSTLTAALTIGRSQPTAVSSVFSWSTPESMNQFPSQPNFSNFIFIHAGSTSGVEGGTVVATTQIFNTVPKTQNANVTMGSAKRENTATSNKTWILSACGFDGVSSYVSSKNLVSVANRAWVSFSGALSVQDSRGYMSSASYGNDAFIGSAFYSSGTTADMQIFRFNIGSFTSTGNQTTARISATMLALKASIYSIAGGTQSGSANITTAIGKLTTNTLAHSNIAAVTATPRSSSTGFVSGSVAWQAGGTDSSGSITSLVESFSGITETVSAATSLVAARTYSRGVCSDVTTGYVIAGALSSVPVSTVIEYSLSNGSSTVTSPTIVTAVAGHGTCSTNTANF